MGAIWAIRGLYGSREAFIEYRGFFHGIGVYMGSTRGLGRHLLIIGAFFMVWGSTRGLHGVYTGSTRGYREAFIDYRGFFHGIFHYFSYVEN